MTTKITNKDKILIYVMVIVLLICGFVWLGILPQVNRASQLETQIAELEVKKSPIETAVIGLPGMQAVVKKNTEDLKESVKAFYPYMETYKIDKMLTGIMISDYGLTVSNMSLNPSPKLEMVPPYAPSYEGLKTAIDLLNKDEQEQQGEQVEIGPEKIPLYTSTVSLSASGAKEKMQSFVDDMFMNYPSIRVTSYTISQVEGTPVLSLTCDIYMQLAE